MYNIFEKVTNSFVLRIKFNFLLMFNSGKEE